MKNYLLTRIIFCIVFLSNFTAKAKAVDPRAVFDKIWIDYDVSEEGVKGMRIHVSFTTYEMKGVDSYVAIFFEYNNDRGGRLKDNNQKFNSSGGDVALYKSINPQYDPAVYSDLQLFMPYSELDLNPGNYQLSMVVELIRTNGDLIQKLTTHNFEYTKPATGFQNTTTSSSTATFNRMWMDYDVTENNRKGMRIHVKFNLTNMKNVDAYLAVYFQLRGGDKLKTTNVNYQSKSGQVAIYKSLLPGYDNADYEDQQLFMPYDELNLGSGKFQLTMVVDVIYKNGDLVKHLTDYDFDFSQ